ncbi:MAG: GWxTD domain-containing protein [Acidobacteriota bacterium]
MYRAVAVRSVLLTAFFFLGLPAFAAAEGQQEQLRKEEKIDYYQKWLAEDVRYIITSEEAEVLKALTMPEEREHFIEQFWFRRDPHPSTAINEFKEEHYRRIAYANEHFDEGTDGWLTDRGRIYIIHGPPDGIESHVAGEISYERRPEEGGGTTAVFPFIRWSYRHIDGVGDNVELEFVDKRFTGAYKLTTDPFEKDALMHTNFGQTLAEMAGFAERVDRYRYSPGFDKIDLRGYREQDNPFEKYRRLMKMEAPQPIKYRDLEQVVETNITYQAFPLKARLDYFRLDEDHVLVSATIQFPNRELVFQQSGNVHVAMMAVYGKVTDLSGRVVKEFDHEIMTSYQSRLLQKGLSEVSMYQKNMMLEPRMRYKLDLVVKDLKSGKMGVIRQAIIPPFYGHEKLASSSVMLTSAMRTLNSAPEQDQMFVLGDVYIRPKLEQVFSRERPLGVYLQLYNVTLDQSSLLPSLRVIYRIVQDGRLLKEVVHAEGESTQYFSPERIVLIQVMALEDLKPGEYSLEIEFQDQIGGQQLSTRDRFEVVEGDLHQLRLSSSNPASPQ